MQSEVVIHTNIEKDVMIKLFSDQKFFFTNFTPFSIANEESDTLFYIYGEFYSLFSAYDVEARVRKYVSSDTITYVLVVQPGLIPASYDNLIDRSYKGISPKGNGKIVVSSMVGGVRINIDYEGDKEKSIVNFLMKSMNKKIKDFDKIVNLERIKRHI